MSQDTVTAVTPAPARVRPHPLAFLVNSPRWLGSLMIAPAVMYIALVVSRLVGLAVATRATR